MVIENDDPMTTVEFKVEQLVRNLCTTTWDIYDLLKDPDARLELRNESRLIDLELCSDQLSKIIRNLGDHL